METKDLISRKFDAIAKIAFAIATERDSLALKLLAPPITKAFEKMEVYGGKPNLSIEENLARFRVNNSEYDIASQVDYFTREQIESPDKKINATEFRGSVFATDAQTKQIYLVNDIYEPSLIENSQFQLPTIVLTRLGIAKEGISGLEEKIKILKSGFTRFTDEDAELFQFLIQKASDPEFVKAFKKAYCVKIEDVRRDTDPTSDGKFELTYTTNGYWDRDFGSFQPEYVSGSQIFRTII